MSSVRPCGTCPSTGKQQYSSPQEAERRRKEIKRLRDEKLSAYRCRGCGKWHLGHR